MKFRSVELFDFLSYESHVFHFEKGMFLIKGANGAGKTALLSAIEWALFGKTSRDQTSKELIREGCDEAKVCVTLEIGGQTISVVRSVSHAKSQLEVLVDGVFASCSTIRETQKKLESILGFDHRGFCSVALYAQGGSSMAAMSDSEKKQVLERVLGFERFRKAREAARKQLSKLQDEATGLVVDRKNTALRLDDWVERKKNLQNHRDTAIEANKLTVERLKQEQKDLEKPVAGFKIDELQDLREKLEEYTSVEKDYDDIAKEIVRLNAVIAQDKVKLWQATDKIEELENLNALMGSVEPTYTTCPTCDQVIEDRAKITALKQQDAKDLKKTKEDLAATRILKQSLEFSIANVEDSVATLERRLEDTRTEFARAEHIRQQITIMESAMILYKREFEAWSKRDKQIRQRIIEATNFTPDRFDKDIANCGRQIAIFETTIAELDRDIAEIQKKIPYYDFWVKAFGRGIQTLIIDTALPYLNKRANLYLSELTGGMARVEVCAQSSTQAGEARDKIEIKVYYPNRPAAYGGKSGGERRRVDIAVQLALGDLVAARYKEPVMWRALDEVLEPLDAEGCEKIIGLLEQHVLPSVGTILVISHQDEMHDKFDQVIHVTNVNGVSCAV